MQILVYAIMLAFRKSGRICIKLVYSEIKFVCIAMCLLLSNESYSRDVGLYSYQ